jgi:hypothetical protein
MISRKMAGNSSPGIVLLPSILFVKKRPLQMLQPPLIISERGGKKKTRYYSLWFRAWFFVEDYWFDVCFRFLTIETWVFYVLRIPDALAFRIISVCLIYCFDTLTHDSGCLSVISIRLSNRTSPLFLVPTRQIGTWKSATRSDFVKACIAVNGKVGRTSRHSEKPLVARQTNEG